MRIRSPTPAGWRDRGTAPTLYSINRRPLQSRPSRATTWKTMGVVAIPRASRRRRPALVPFFALRYCGQLHRHARPASPHRYTVHHPDPPSASTWILFYSSHTLAPQRKIPVRGRQIEVLKASRHFVWANTPWRHQDHHQLPDSSGSRRGESRHGRFNAHTIRHGESAHRRQSSCLNLGGAVFEDYGFVLNLSTGQICRT